MPELKPLKERIVDLKQGDCLDLKCFERVCEVTIRSKCIAPQASAELQQFFSLPLKEQEKRIQAGKLPKFPKEKGVSYLGGSFERREIRVDQELVTKSPSKWNTVLWTFTAPAQCSIREGVHYAVLQELSCERK